MHESECGWDGAGAASKVKRYRRYWSVFSYLRGAEHHGHRLIFKVSQSGGPKRVLLRAM